ncbi:cysteine hydrolase family protein [Thermodesulfobacteriota bacterium]
MIVTIPDILLKPRQCALINIDMQNDFVSSGGYADRHGKDYRQVQPIIPAIQYLVRELPEELKRIYIMTVREPDGSDYHWRFHKIMPDKIRDNLKNNSTEHNVFRGTWGAEIVDPLKPEPKDHIFYKRRYSAFYQTDLEMCLRSWGIDTLIFTGVVAEICVETTVRSAFVRDFDIIVIKDAVGSWNEEAYQSFLRLVSESLGVVVTAAKLNDFLGN